MKKAKTTPQVKNKPKHPPKPETPPTPSFTEATKDEKNINALWIMAGKYPGRWWWVWSLGPPNPFNLGRRPRYFLGVVSGEEDEITKKMRKWWWPKFKGRLLAEEMAPIQK